MRKHKLIEVTQIAQSHIASRGGARNKIHIVHIYSRELLISIIRYILP